MNLNDTADLRAVRGIRLLVPECRSSVEEQNWRFVTGYDLLVCFRDLIACILTLWHCKQKQVQFSSVQSLSHVRLFATPWTAARQASLSITNSWSLLKLMSIELRVQFSHIILCHPLFLLPSVFPSMRVFSSESVLHIRWPKYWSFSFSISPSNEYLGLISFRVDRLDLLAVQGTIKSLIQHHNSKASIIQPLQCSCLENPRDGGAWWAAVYGVAQSRTRLKWLSSNLAAAFFIVQLSHLYMTTGKTIALTN